jgi:hypothetical protein
MLKEPGHTHQTDNHGHLWIETEIRDNLPVTF